MVYIDYLERKSSSFLFNFVWILQPRYGSIDSCLIFQPWSPSKLKFSKLNFLQNLQFHFSHGFFLKTISKFNLAYIMMLFLSYGDLLTYFHVAVNFPITQFHKLWLEWIIEIWILWLKVWYFSYCHANLHAYHSNYCMCWWIMI